MVFSSRCVLQKMRTNLRSRSRPHLPSCTHLLSLAFSSHHLTRSLSPLQRYSIFRQPSLSRNPNVASCVPLLVAPSPSSHPSSSMYTLLKLSCFQCFPLAHSLPLPLSFPRTVHLSHPNHLFQSLLAGGIHKWRDERLQQRARKSRDSLFPLS